MQHGSENVCLALDEGRNLFAVGSRSYVTLIDPRAKHSGRSECQALYSPDAGNGTYIYVLLQAMQVLFIF